MVAKMESVNRFNRTNSHSPMPMQALLPPSDWNSQCRLTRAASLKKTNWWVGDRLIVIEHIYPARENNHLDKYQPIFWIWICLFFPQGLSQYHLPKAYSVWVTNIESCIFHWTEWSALEQMRFSIGSITMGSISPLTYHTAQKLPIYKMINSFWAAILEPRPWEEREPSPKTWYIP